MTEMMPQQAAIRIQVKILQATPLSTAVVSRMLDHATAAHAGNRIKM